jgi:arylsulfatase A-like enzyme
MVLAGGGLQTGQVVGVTDELGQEIVQEPVSLADFHATIYAAVGIDPSKELFDGDRPVPITDAGKPIERLFSS